MLINRINITELVYKTGEQTFIQKKH